MRNPLGCLPFEGVGVQSSGPLAAIDVNGFWMCRSDPAVFAKHYAAIFRF